MFVRISKASFYPIYPCPELQLRFPQTCEECQVVADDFASISRGEVITNCVGAVDGFLLEIAAPPDGIVANVRSYYSGHYKRYGVNIQACCDHLSRFTYIAVAGPGVMNDNLLVKDEIDLGALIKNLPLRFCIIGDAAYAASERLVPMYYGADKFKPMYGNFNFYALQLRIRIEMAFGMMTRK
jgi:DDE superfamily endonuclease